MNSNAPLLITFTAYLLLVLFLGLLAYRRTHNLGDYILGGRKLGPVVTALSVGASDMSGWLLLGLPGAIYLAASLHCTKSLCSSKPLSAFICCCFPVAT